MVALPDELHHQARPRHPSDRCHPWGGLTMGGHGPGSTTSEASTSRPRVRARRPGGEGAADGVAGRVEERRERAERALAGRDRDDAAADAALARHADVEQPVARRLVHARRSVITASVACAVSGSTTRSPVSGLVPPSASVAPITARSTRGHATGSSAGCRSRRPRRVAVEGAEAGSMLASAAVAVVGRAGRREGLVVELERAAGAPRQAVEHALPALLDVAAGHQAGGRDGPGVDHRVGPAVRVALDGRRRVEGQAGRIDPDPTPYLLDARRRRRPARRRTAWRCSSAGRARRRRRTVTTSPPTDATASPNRAGSAAEARGRPTTARPTRRRGTARCASSTVACTASCDGSRPAETKRSGDASSVTGQPACRTRPWRPFVSVAVDPSTVTATFPSSAISTDCSTWSAGGGQAIRVTPAGANSAESPSVVTVV